MTRLRDSRRGIARPWLHTLWFVDTQTDQVPWVRIVGVRGTFEDFEDTHLGMGPVVGSMALALAERVRTEIGAQVQLIGVPYPARAIPYRRSRRKGVESLIAILTDPRSVQVRTILIGLSQGADVIRHALASFDASPVATQTVEAVILLGDPGRKCHEKYQKGTNDSASGILAAEAPDLPPDIGARTWSYCLEGDEICANHHRALALIRSGTHTEYGFQQWGIQEMGVRFAFNRLR